MKKQLVKDKQDRDTFFATQESSENRENVYSNEL